MMRPTSARWSLGMGPTVFDPAEPIKVIFSDGAVNIPAGPIPIDQRAEVGRIITALREGVNF